MKRDTVLRESVSQNEIMVMSAAAISRPLLWYSSMYVLVAYSFGGFVQSSKTVLTDKVHLGGFTDTEPHFWSSGSVGRNDRRELE